MNPTYGTGYRVNPVTSVIKGGGNIIQQRDSLSKSWSHIDWLIIVIFAGLVVLFHWRILTPNLADRQSFPPGDFQAQFWAFSTFEARELGAGRLPLWNPYNFSGSPFWADVQAAVFYPPSLLTILLSAPWGFSLFALEIEAIAHFWLAAVFMYLFIRQATGNRAAAFISALLFTFSGYLTGYPAQQLAVLEVDVWLPLILFFIHRRYEAGAKNRSATIINLLLAGVAWGMALLAGHPQSALIVAYISSAYLIFMWFTGSTRTLIHLLTNWLIFISTGLALAAVQFLPAIEYTLLSVRAAGSYDKMSGGFPLVDIIQILLPGQISFYSPLYVGVVGLVLATTAIFTPSRHKTFWAVTAALSLLISYGGNSFLYSPLYLFSPGFSIFRGQERWAFAVAFSVAVLAGYGFAELLNRNEAYLKQLSSLTKQLFLFALMLTLLFFYGLNSTGWKQDSQFFNLLGTATLLTLLLGLAWLLWRLESPLLLTALTAGLICFDLFTINWQTNLYPQLPEWHTQIPAAVSAIKEDAVTFNEPYRVYNEYRLYDNYGVPSELEDMWGASPLRPARYDKFISPPMPIERTWELLNVRYVITWRQELYVPSTIIYQEPTEKDVTYVHRLNNPAPRAWLAFQTETGDDNSILQKIAAPSFNRQTALLEPGTEQYILQNSEPGEQQILRTASNPSQIRYNVTSSAPALLILSETDYPGWQATVDGLPAPILRADYILRAVSVPAGKHTVELTFRPLSFTVGAIISMLTIIVVIVSIIMLRKRERSDFGVDIDLARPRRFSKPARSEHSHLGSPHLDSDKI